MSSTFISCDANRFSPLFPQTLHFRLSADSGKPQERLLADSKYLFFLFTKLLARRLFWVSQFNVSLFSLSGRSMPV